MLHKSGFGHLLHVCVCVLWVFLGSTGRASPFPPCTFAVGTLAAEHLFLV